MAEKTKLHFSRFEFKYILRGSLRREVEKELRHFVELDPFVAEQPDHLYIVRSLYFDDPDFSSFYEKTDGVHTRAKFRLRTYTRDPEDPAPEFLEIKGRYDNLVFKHRTPMRGRTPPECSGDALSRHILDVAEPGAVRNQFEFELFRKQLRPVVVIDYLRRPYISKFDPEFRLTFDEQLRGTVSKTLFPGPNRTSRGLVPGYTVMEVKFRHRVPAWFHRIIQSYGLRRVSISKICTGTERLELAADLS